MSLCLCVCVWLAFPAFEAKRNNARQRQSNISSGIARSRFLRAVALRPPASMKHLFGQWCASISSRADKSVCLTTVSESMTVSSHH